MRRLLIGVAAAGVLAAGVTVALTGSSVVHWRNTGGQTTGGEVIERPGTNEHCHWGSATILSFNDGSFVKDPEGIFRQRFQWDPKATLPADARFTGWSDDDRRLWVSPGDIERGIGDRYANVYIARRGVVERWPRFNSGCM